MELSIFLKLSLLLPGCTPQSCNWLHVNMMKHFLKKKCFLGLCGGSENRILQYLCWKKQQWKYKYSQAEAADDHSNCKLRHTNINTGGNNQILGDGLLY